MKKEEYLNQVSKQIQFIFDRNSITEELGYHLSDSIADLIDEGLSREEAELVAVKQMGDPVMVGKMLNQEHHPLIGYLWIFSKVVLGLLILPTFITLCSFCYGVYNMITPTVISDSIETISIAYEVKTPTQKIMIDNICINEDGEYYLTYRAWTNYEYSRSGWSMNPIDIVDDEGMTEGGAGFVSSNFLGQIGYRRFELSEDGIINISLKDGEIIELDLEEYR